MSNWQEAKEERKRASLERHSRLPGSSRKTDLPLTGKERD